MKNIQALIEEAQKQITESQKQIEAAREEIEKLRKEEKNLVDAKEAERLIKKLLLCINNDIGNLPSRMRDKSIDVNEFFGLLKESLEYDFEDFLEELEDEDEDEDEKPAPAPESKKISSFKVLKENGAYRLTAPIIYMDIHEWLENHSGEKCPRCVKLMDNKLVIPEDTILTVEAILADGYGIFAQGDRFVFDPFAVNGYFPAEYLGQAPTEEDLNKIKNDLPEDFEDFLEMIFD